MTPIERRGFLLNWWDQLLKTPTLQLSPVCFQSLHIRLDPVPCFKIILFQAAIIQRAVQTQATRSDQADEIHFPFQWSCFCQGGGNNRKEPERVRMQSREAEHLAWSALIRFNRFWKYLATGGLISNNSWASHYNLHWQQLLEYLTCKQTLFSKSTRQ